MNKDKGIRLSIMDGDERMVFKILGKTIVAASLVGSGIVCGYFAGYSKGYDQGRIEERRDVKIELQEQGYEIGESIKDYLDGQRKHRALDQDKLDGKVVDELPGDISFRQEALDSLVLGYDIQRI